MSGYRYDLPDYADSPCLCAEIEDFYSFLEKYRDKKTRLHWSFLDKQRMYLFFSTKHRIVERYITQVWM